MKFILLLILIINIISIKAAPNFSLKFKGYDFKSTQPGFNISYDEFSKIAKTSPKSGMIKDDLDPITRKPIYCCGDKPYSYIQNEKVFDQSFKETEGVTKSLILNADFYKRYKMDKSIDYQSVQKFYYPFNGKGWDDSNPNLYWCMEGHFEFSLTSLKDQLLSIQFDGDRFVFVNGKKVIEYINIDEINSVYRPINLELKKKYPLDIFLCQRFDQYKPSKMLSMMSTFIINCVNYEGINDDSCPYERPPCIESKDCNDNDKCTIDKCPTSSIPKNDTYLNYCSHTPIQCASNIKCQKSNGCNKETGQCEFTPDDSKCDDNNSCTIDKCTSNGCTNEPMKCEIDKKNKCITNVSCVDGKCLTQTKSCPNKKSSILGLITLSCRKQKCEPSNGNCVDDGPSNDCDKTLL